MSRLKGAVGAHNEIVDHANYIPRAGVGLVISRSNPILHQMMSVSVAHFSHYADKRIAELAMNIVDASFPSPSWTQTCIRPSSLTQRRWVHKYRYQSHVPRKGLLSGSNCWEGFSLLNGAELRSRGTTTNLSLPLLVHR